MPPATRWHRPSCKGRDIRVIGCLPWCIECESEPTSGTGNCIVPTASSNNPHRIDIPSHHRLQLSWPASVTYSPAVDIPVKADVASAPRMGSTAAADPAPHFTAPGRDLATAESAFFDYEDLLWPDEFRVLELTQGETEDPLHGVLWTHRTREYAAYEALSYTWGCYDDADSYGDVSKSEVIYLGKFWDPFPITRNCANALRRLRYPQRQRFIWVDSICINQSNRAELGHQVNLMHQIYENALTVVVYLGVATTDSDFAMQLLRHPEHLIHSLLDDYSSSCLVALFNRPYFTRIWIVQEVALAKSLHFYCGHSETFYSPITKTHFESLLGTSTAPAWLSYSRQEQRVHVDGFMRSLTPAQDSDLLSLMEATSSCKWSDPRDRIFALLGLVKSAQQQELVPDYHLSVEQLYTGVAAFLMQSTKWQAKIAIRILRLAARSPIGTLPSWVPDWAEEQIFLPYVEDAVQFSAINTKELEIFFPVRGISDRNESEKCFWPDSRISISGQLNLRGILLSRYLPTIHTSRGDVSTYLQKEGVAMAFLFLGNGTRKSRLDKEVRSPVFFMLLDYSTVLLLLPIAGSPAFRFIDIGGLHTAYKSFFGAIFDAELNTSELDVVQLEADRPSTSNSERSRVPEDGRRRKEELITQLERVWSLCLLPFSPAEHALMSGVLSRPGEFPCIQHHPISLWKENAEDWLKGDAILPQDILDPTLPEYYSVGTRLWNQWKEYHAKGMAILHSRTQLDLILARLQAMEELGDRSTINFRGQDFKGKFGAEIAAFLSLFILDPMKPYCNENNQESVAAWDCGLKGDVDDFIGDPLKFIRDWQSVTMDLINHLEQKQTSLLLTSWGVSRDRILFQRREVWDHHMRVSRIMGSGKTSWLERDAWFMIKKIKRQRVDGKDIGLAREYGRFNGEAYWDWAEMEAVINSQMELWPEINRLRTKLEQEWSRNQTDIDLMIWKIRTRKVLKLLDVSEFSDFVEETITIA